MRGHRPVSLAHTSEIWRCLEETFGGRVHGPITVVGHSQLS